MSCKHLGLGEIHYIEIEWKKGVSQKQMPYLLGIAKTL